MASSTGTPGTTASCTFQAAEGRACGETQVYGAGKDALRFCWSHYVLLCGECKGRQSRFECAMVTAAGSYCRIPICSEACYKAHQEKHHPAAWQPSQRKITLQVVFADGGIYESEVQESALAEEIVFQHPVHKTHHRCLKRPVAGPGGCPVYAEVPPMQKPLPPPLEIPRAPAQPPPMPAARSGASFQHRPQNAVTAFSLHVSWLTALIETRDERIVRVLPPNILQRLEQALVETTVALLETSHHGS